MNSSHTGHKSPAFHHRGKEGGFSLIELMVAMGIGTVILLALTVMFSVNSGNQNELEQSLRKLENARYAMDVISEDIMHAGYYSDFSPAALPLTPLSYQLPNPCATGVADQGWNTASSPLQLPVPIQGIAKTDTSATAGCLTNRLANTAAIIVRHAETGTGTLASATTSTNLYVQISGCKSDVLRVLASAGPLANFTLLKPDCTTKEPNVRRLIQRIYYIATCNDCTPSDGIPTLRRVEMINGTLQNASIAEGIENLQFEYGVDTSATADGQPDAYVANAVIATGNVANYLATDWQKVVSVRLHLLARNTQKTAGYSDNRTYVVGPDVSVASPNDGFKRMLLTTTIRLNNVAGRLE